jgi:hypothetical protein
MSGEIYGITHDPVPNTDPLVEAGEYLTQPLANANSSAINYVGEKLVDVIKAYENGYDTKLGSLFARVGIEIDRTDNAMVNDMLLNRGWSQAEIDALGSDGGATQWMIANIHDFMSSPLTISEFGSSVAKTFLDIDCVGMLGLREEEVDLDVNNVAEDPLIKFPDSNGNGWISRDENRQEFMNDFGNYILSKGVSVEQAQIALKMLMFNDLDKNGVSDILDHFFPDSRFVDNERFEEIIWNYSDFDNDLVLNIYDADNNNNLIPDYLEYWNPKIQNLGKTVFGYDNDLRNNMLRVDYSNDGISDYYKYRNDLDPSKEYDSSILPYISERLTVFDTNSTIDEANVFYMPFVHGKVGTDDFAYGRELGAEFSGFINSYASKYPDRKIVVLLEGIDSNSVIPIEAINPNDLNFNYLVKPGLAEVNGWDNAVALANQFDAMEAVKTVSPYINEQGYPGIDSGHIDDLLAGMNGGFWKEIEEFNLHRDESMIETMSRFIDDGYTVFVTAGSAHYSDSTIVREFLDGHKYMIVTDGLPFGRTDLRKSE